MQSIMEGMMKIGVLGTGIVGQTIGAKLAQLGHGVMVGTRDVGKTMARSDPDPYGQPPFSAWAKQNPGVKVGGYAEAASYGEAVINATNGMGSLDALRQAGGSNLKGKILVDISNPLDFSKGMPPFLSVCNTDSLGEQIQRAFPEAKVVKTLNTVTAGLMVNPRQIADGEHHIFLSGNDPAAKAQVASWLADWFGWKHILDLGDITTSRGAEMYLPLWLRLWGALGTGMLNIQVVK
jgi:8-hydroxy-5-deazaflavin:NADPH oxidoreductase